MNHPLSCDFTRIRNVYLVIFFNSTFVLTQQFSFISFSQMVVCSNLQSMSLFSLSLPILCYLIQHISITKTNLSDFNTFDTCPQFTFGSRCGNFHQTNSVDIPAQKCSFSCLKIKLDTNNVRMRKQTE